LGPWLLGLLTGPGVGLGAAAAGVAVAPKGLRDLQPREARQLAARGHLLACAGLGRYLMRPLWPLTAAALVSSSPRRRRVIMGTVLIGTADHVRRRLVVDRLDGFSLATCARIVAASILDDAAYSMGVWQGCWRERTWSPLLPRVRDLPRFRGTRT
jgi:hypothetical protein